MMENTSNDYSIPSADNSADRKNSSFDQKSPELKPLLKKGISQRDHLFSTMPDDIGRGAVYRMRLSRAYIAYCILMAIASVSLVIYMICDIHVNKNSISIPLVVLDGILSFAIVIETIMDLYLLGWQFWSSGWHVFDFAVSLLCLVSWILMLLELVYVIRSFDEYVTIVLVSIRYISQIIRVIRYIRACADAKGTQTAVDENEVRFDEFSAADKKVIGKPSVFETA